MLNEFLRRIVKPRQNYISPDLLCRQLGMPVGELARVVHVHRNTLARQPSSSLVQSRVGPVARIIAMASELIGDLGQAVIWFNHQPLAGFDDKTAKDLVAAGHADAVIKHLQSLADGNYA